MAVIIVMGVAGAGKTTVGRALAEALGCAFYDADDLHPEDNVARMRAGQSLTDDDREPWLAAIEALIASLVSRETPAVLACSALRARYRERLRHPGVRFVFLRIDPAEAARRIETRTGHFMPAALVESQFAALEVPRDALVLDASRPPSELVEEIVRTA